MATVAEKLLTAEEYQLLPDDGRRTELIRGRIVAMNMPTPRHGYICGKVVGFLRKYLDDHDLGRIMCNDSAVVTERDPDTVRGADIAFYSYARLPRGPFPEGYLDVVPELVFEVRSPTDRWRDVLAKVIEYLDAGVTLVCVLDPGTESARVYGLHQPERVVSSDQEMTLTEVLPDFRVIVRRFFE